MLTRRDYALEAVIITAFTVATLVKSGIDGIKARLRRA